MGANPDDLNTIETRKTPSTSFGGMMGDSRSRTNSMITGGTTKVIENLNIDCPSIEKD